MRYFKHESAYVDDGAVIGEGTKVWHFCHIQSGAKIGDNCIFGQNVNIANDVVIGNGVKVQNNVTVYTGTTIDDYVFLGPSCVFTNVTNPRSEINRHALYEPIHLCRGVSVGANATIVCGVTIGCYAFVGAGAVVTTDVPDYAMVVGCPARIIGYVSRHGHLLVKTNASGFDLPVEILTTTYTCPESKLRYRFKQTAEGGFIFRCIDLDEATPLPDALRVGTKTYDDFKGEK